MARAASDEMRAKILDAAQQRVWRYGFKKSTIDEIAADAGVGKGTVYLHFKSKEEIGMAIVAQFKEESLKQQAQACADPSLSPPEKLKRMLAMPVQAAHQRCSETPAATEMVSEIRPHLHDYLKGHLEKEYRLLAEAIEQGNRDGTFNVSDPMNAARLLKVMTLCLMPPSWTLEMGDVPSVISDLIDLVVLGLRRCVKE